MNTRKRTVVVALDMNDAEEANHPFNELSPTEKIDFICDRIKKVYEELSKTEPDSQIIITWRENGICNRPGELAINKEEINYLKNKMQQITKQNKNLVIIAGATPVHKKAPHARLEKYLQRYQTIPFFEEFRKIEEALKQEDDLQIKAHEEQLLSVQKNYPGKNVDVIYTSCYVFYGDKIHRTDKSTPFNEDKIHGHLKRPIVYRPTKSGRINPLLFAKHPATDEEIDVGIEVCREHALDVLSTSEKIPFIHFVLSDFMYLRIAKIRSPYAVFLDSKSRPRLVFIPENLTEEQKQNPSEVVLYISNIFKDEKIQGPFQPTSSFASKIMTILDFFANTLN